MEEYIVTLMVVVKVKDEDAYSAKMSAIREIIDKVDCDITKLCCVTPVVKEEQMI